MSMRDILYVIQDEAAIFSNERFERYLKRSKIVTPHYIQDFKILKERSVDYEYIQQLNTLSFIEEARNLIIYGSAGTGKTWTEKSSQQQHACTTDFQCLVQKQLQSFNLYSNES